jgi:hypothetical protein
MEDVSTCVGYGKPDGFFYAVGGVPADLAVEPLNIKSRSNLS